MSSRLNVVDPRYKITIIDTPGGLATGTLRFRGSGRRSVVMIIVDPQGKRSVVSLQFTSTSNTINQWETNQDQGLLPHLVFLYGEECCYSCISFINKDKSLIGVDLFLTIFPITCITMGKIFITHIISIKMNGKKNLKDGVWK